MQVVPADLVSALAAERPEVSITVAPAPAPAVVNITLAPAPAPADVQVSSFPELHLPSQQSHSCTQPEAVVCNIAA